MEVAIRLYRSCRFEPIGPCFKNAVAKAVYLGADLARIRIFPPRIYSQATY